MTESYYLYINSWGHFGTEKNLSLYKFNSKEGQAVFIKKICSNLCCNFNLYDDRTNVLYVLNESDSFEINGHSGAGGSVHAFKVNKEDGSLSEICAVPSYGADPCFLSIDKSGKYMIVANHGSRSKITKIKQDTFGKFRMLTLFDDSPVVLYSLNNDGSINNEPLDIFMLPDAGSIKPQRHSSFHTALFSPSENFFVVNDIGLDRIYLLKINDETKKIEFAAAPFYDKADATPRFCVFHPLLPIFYVNHETGSFELYTFKYDKNGFFERCDSVGAGPAGYVKKPHDEQQVCCIHPSGKYVYDAVNGPECISCFALQEETGIPALVHNIPLRGKWARGCNLSPDGEFLAATCMISGDIEIFKIMPDGRPEHTGCAFKQPGAVWTTFIREERQ
jgi:6-phosphogluconolactonase